MSMMEMVRFDAACPPDKAFFIPPDVSVAMDLMESAAVMVRHGIMDGATYLGIVKEVTERAVQAAREGRIVMITNLGE